MFKKTVATALALGMLIATPGFASAQSVTETLSDLRSQLGMLQSKLAQMRSANTGQVVMSSSTLGLGKIYLVDNLADRDIKAVDNYEVLDITRIDRDFNVRVVTTDDVASVRFDLVGPVSHTNIDSVRPFTSSGDIAGDYDAIKLPDGSYTLTMVPYSGTNLSGTAGGAVVYNFEIVSGEFTDNTTTCKNHIVGGERVVTTDYLFARESPGVMSNIVKLQPLGSTGTVSQTQCLRPGYTWAWVDYDNGISGWSAVDWLSVR